MTSKRIVIHFEDETGREVGFHHRKHAPKREECLLHNGTIYLVQRRWEDVAAVHFGARPERAVEPLGEAG